MAQNIYDEYGRKVGEVKSEEEARDDGWIDFVDGIGCLAVLIGGFAVLVSVCLWVMPFFIERVLFVFEIPVLIATVVAGAKYLNANQISPWGVFGRVTLIDTAVATVVGIVGCALSGESFGGEEIGEIALIGVLYSIVPAIIVALMARRRKR